MPILSVLVVVILTIPYVCGDEGGPRWCGGELVSMLELVCGGQYFGVLDRSKRSANVLPISNNKLDSSHQTLKELRDLKSIILNSKRGGVADECCLRSCTFEQLQNYCLYDQTNNGLIPETDHDNENGEFEVNKTLEPTTTSSEITESTTHAIRSGVRTRQKNTWFFLQSVGHNPTRRPF